MNRRDHHHLNRMTGVFLLIAAALVGLLHLTDEPVREDAEQAAPKVVKLSEVAVDPFHSIPTPAPSYVDSTALCRVRAGLYGIAVPVGDPERAFARCDSALDAEGEEEWRTLVGVGR